MLKNSVAATSWGDTHIYMGAVGEGETMGQNLSDLGIIDEDGLSIETNDGTEYQIKDINGQIIDSLMQEPELTINCTLLKPTEETRGKFWDMQESGEGASRKVEVKSMIAKNKYSVMFSNPKMAGSETFEAPKCSVSMKPEWAPAKGFTGVIAIKLLKGMTGTIFQFGTVPASEESSSEE